MSLDWINVLNLAVYGISTIAIWELMKYAIRYNRKINLVDEYDAEDGKDDICEICGKTRIMHLLGKVDDNVIPKWCDDKEDSLKFAKSEQNEVKKE